MGRRAKKTAGEVKTCKECKYAQIDFRWLTPAKKPFCIICQKDGLLKLMKWKCTYKSNL